MKKVYEDALCVVKSGKAGELVIQNKRSSLQVTVTGNICLSIKVPKGYTLTPAPSKKYKEGKNPHDFLVDLYQ